MWTATIQLAARIQQGQQVSQRVGLLSHARGTIVPPHGTTRYARCFDMPKVEGGGRMVTTETQRSQSFSLLLNIKNSVFSVPVVNISIYLKIN